MWHRCGACYVGGYLVLPTLFDSLSHPLGVLFAVVLVQVGCLDIRGRASVGVIEETLNARQHGGDVVCGTPAILKDVKAEFARGIDIGMEHLTNKLDGGRLIRILLLEMHHEAKSSIFERSVRGSYYYGIPCHDIIRDRRGGDTSRGVGLHALEITHQTATSGCRHGSAVVDKERGKEADVALGCCDLHRIDLYLESVFLQRFENLIALAVSVWQSVVM